ncbi:MAG: hypothetical protein V2A70_01355, partial [Candidatus Omnitrophota bacterium]
ADKGGVYLNPSGLEINNNVGREGISFNIDRDMLKRLQHAPGIKPVIIGIHSAGSLRHFMENAVP